MTQLQDPFFRVGNHLAADFANTVFSPDDARGTLRTAKDVLAFLTETGALAGEDAGEVRRRLQDDAAAQRFLSRALQLRSAVREALVAVEHHHTLNDAALKTLNDVLRSDAGHLHLERTGKARYELVHERSRAQLDYALAPMAQAAAELLAMPDAPVRKCASDDCIRYFYDDSRTRRRRWCEMAVCGNRAKTAAFLRRKRTAK